MIRNEAVPGLKQLIDRSHILSKIKFCLITSFPRVHKTLLSIQAPMMATQ